jgi:hypothetical protein
MLQGVVSVQQQCTTAMPEVRVGHYDLFLHSIGLLRHDVDCRTARNSQVLRSIVRCQMQQWQVKQASELHVEESVHQLQDQALQDRA